MLPGRTYGRSLETTRCSVKTPLLSSDLSLGGPDAWSTQEGRSLTENFLPVRQFEEIAFDEKSFLSGRRGSGKSAIARMLERSPDWEYRRAIQGERGEYGEYMSVVSKLAQDRDMGRTVYIKQSVRRLWTWVLPVVAMQTILNSMEDSDQSLDNDSRCMKSYVDTLPYGLTVNSSIGHLLNHVFAATQKGPEADGCELLDLLNAPSYVAALKALTNKTRKAYLLLVLDTLESYRVFQPEMVEGLQGVLEAINAHLSNPQLTGVSIKFFIPAEIYDVVVAGFPGKMHARTVFLRWRAADIISMLARRLLSVLHRTDALPQTELNNLKRLVDSAYDGTDGRHLRKQFWYDTHFLPATIRNMVGKEEDTFAYILRHTMRRPRDLITAVMQSIVNEAAAANTFPRCSAEDVVKGVHNPIALMQILKEAIAPYEDDFPDELVRAAQAAFYNRSQIMTGRELKQFAKELYTLRSVEHIELDSFVSALLKCGVVGLLDEEHEAQSPSSIYIKARFEHLMQGNLPLLDRLRYCVHPVMANAFKMKRPADGRVVYPLPTEDLWLEHEAHIA